MEEVGEGGRMWDRGLPCLVYCGDFGTRELASHLANEKQVYTQTTKGYGILCPLEIFRESGGHKGLGWGDIEREKEKES